VEAAVKRPGVSRRLSRDSHGGTAPEAASRPGESRRLLRDSHGGTAKPFLRSPRVRVNSQRGVTVVELLVVLIIMGTVLGALTTLFVRGMKAELEADQRFRAQDQARLAVDRMRRELHCASAVVATATSVTATLAGHCPSAVSATTTTVVYSFQNAGTSRYKLRRSVNGGAAATVADYITTDNAFAYTDPSTSSLGKLSLDLQVNVKPDEGWKTWRLQTDIVLRNTVRA
jgi:type II secretory pathway pseudopilin PulG